jgi:hypothetical protein
MQIKGIKIPAPPSRRVTLSRAVTATVFPKEGHDEVCFSTRGQGRYILLCALQDKPDFLQLVQRFKARVVACVDGQLYFLTSSATDDFIAEVGRLVEAFIPEMPD